MLGLTEIFEGKARGAKKAEMFQLPDFESKIKDMFGKGGGGLDRVGLKKKEKVNSKLSFSESKIFGNVMNKSKSKSAFGNIDVKGIIGGFGKSNMKIGGFGFDNIKKPNIDVKGIIGGFGMNSGGFSFRDVGKSVNTSQFEYGKKVSSFSFGGMTKPSLDVARIIGGGFGSMKTGAFEIEQRAFGQTVKNPDVSAWFRVGQQRGLPIFGDADRDGVKNIFDCDPFDRFKQGAGDSDSNIMSDLGIEDVTPRSSISPVETYGGEESDTMAIGSTPYWEESRTSDLMPSKEVFGAGVASMGREEEPAYSIPEMKFEKTEKKSKSKRKPEVVEAEIIPPSNVVTTYGETVLTEKGLKEGMPLKAKIQELGQKQQEQEILTKFKGDRLGIFGYKAPVTKPVEKTFKKYDDKGNVIETYTATAPAEIEPAQYGWGLKAIRGGIIKPYEEKMRERREMEAQLRMASKTGYIEAAKEAARRKGSSITERAKAAYIRELGKKGIYAPGILGSEVFAEGVSGFGGPIASAEKMAYLSGARSTTGLGVMQMSQIGGGLSAFTPEAAMKARQMMGMGGGGLSEAVGVQPAYGGFGPSSTGAPIVISKQTAVQGEVAHATGPASSAGYQPLPPDEFGPRYLNLKTKKVVRYPRGTYK